MIVVFKGFPLTITLSGSKTVVSGRPLLGRLGSLGQGPLAVRSVRGRSVFVQAWRLARAGRLGMDVRCWLGLREIGFDIQSLLFLFLVFCVVPRSSFPVSCLDYY